MKNIQDLKIVVIGGGTGLANLLRGLKNETSNITAIVTMADDGYSSGQLRREFHILPPGDIRNCVVALSNEEELYHKVFAYRFPHGRGLKGHNLGNLILLALEDITGSFKKAIQEMSRILNIKGKVLPSTYDDVILSAKLTNGRTVWGQRAINNGGHRSPICEVELHPKDAKANTEAIKAIEKADVILIGPGSLYTSIIPNFLLTDIAKTVVESKARRIYICNVSTERGETENYSVKDHIEVLVKHANPKIIDTVLVNSKIILKSSGKRLGEVKNITTGETKIGNYKIIPVDLIDENSPLYHNSKKLAAKILDVIEK